VIGLSNSQEDSAFSKVWRLVWIEIYFRDFTAAAAVAGALPVFFFKY
jgi:hypothetical protein